MDIKLLFLIILQYSTVLYARSDTNATDVNLFKDFKPRKSSGDTGRFLIFNKGGSIRMICGFLVPTFIPKYQNINVLNNWSVGFNVPTTNKDWYSKFSGTSNWAVNKRSMNNLEEVSDDTRERFYKFIVKQFEKFGSNGYACLLRTICQVAEAPIKHNGLIGEILHLAFTPGDDETISQEYKLSKKAGYHGADCTTLYSDCPYGHSFLDKFSVLGYFTSKNFLDAFL